MGVLTYPIQSTRLDHVEARPSCLGTWDLSTRARLGPAANLSINGEFCLGIPATNNRGYTKRPYAGVQRVRLHVSSQAVDKRRGRNGALVYASPRGSLISSSGSEVTAIWN